MVSAWWTGPSLCKLVMCITQVHIAFIMNTNAGKIVKVKGHVYHVEKSVIEVVLAFIYQSRFMDYQNTFETTEEPDYLVLLLDNVAVGILQSKEWFQWDNASTPHQARTVLIFRVQPQVTFKNKTYFQDLLRVLKC